jgi:DNA-binding SARP family transcriptional activator
VEFRLLGPLEVLRDGRPVSLGGQKPRAVLAILLLNANRVVSADRLIDALWGESPPSGAANTLQAHVSSLRKALADKDAGSADGRIRTQRPGYVIDVRPEELDLVRFEHLVERGHAALAAGDAQSAARLLHEALGLWRGRALADFAYEPFAEHESARLEELRLVALEERIEADLGAGRHRELVPELERLAAEHPLRERLRGQLILALYRAGRQADALRVYQETRRVLIDELGIEPSPALQQLERAILVQDAGLEAKAPKADGALPPLIAPPVRPREVRKTVTIVHASLIPSSDAEGPPDPEAAYLAGAAGRETAVRLLEQRGGSVPRVSGDAVVAYFGTPVVKEDDVLRALTAALELRTAIGSHDGAPTAQIGVSAGVATGEVMAIEQEGAQPHVIGEPARLAARLDQAAAAGEILISEETRRLAREATLVEPTAPLPVKGRRQAVPAWRLLEVLEGAEPIRRRLQTPMLGREGELETLRAAFERSVVGREAVLATIVGTAGIGKSRLARELREQLEDEATVLSGRCLSYGEGITYWPLAEIVRQAAGEPERVAELLPDEPEAMLVAERLAAAVGGGELGGSREETFWAARTFLEGIARGRPVVVVVDDLHWAEATFLDLLAHVADFTRDAPILLVCLSRPELIGDRPDWFDGKPQTVSLQLEPLSERESEQLIDGLLGRTPLTADTRRRIAEAAEGNPLFLEQLVTMLIQETRPEATDERSEPEAFSIPPTIHALLAARLDRLGGDERRLLDCSAVIGRVFWRSALETLSGAGNGDIGAALEGLARKQLIQPDKGPFGSEEGYSFRHGLIHETAYLAIPKTERADLHERFGDWLEDDGGRLAAEHEEIVGYHLEQAYRYRTELGATAESQRGIAQRAALHLGAAGRRAYARGDLPAAVNLLSRAVSLMRDDDPVRLERLVDLGEALREVGDFDWARSVLEEALLSASERQDGVTASHARIVLRRIEGQLGETAVHELVEDAERAIGVFEPAHDERGLGKAWHLLAFSALFECRAGTAEAAARRAVEHARRARDNRTEAHGLGLLAGCALLGPTPVADGLRTWDEILAEPPAQRRVLATACRALAGLNAMVGRFDEAREYVRRDKEILAELGLRLSSAGAAEVYGLVEQLAGNVEAAAHEFERGRRFFEEVGERSGLSTLACYAAEACCDLGRYEEARRLSVTGEETATPDDLASQMLWRAARARCAAAAGDLNEAERLARDGVAVAERTDFIVMHATTLRSLAEVLLKRGDASGAAAATRAALELYERKGNVVAAKRTRAALLAVAPSATYP